MFGLRRLGVAAGLAATVGMACSSGGGQAGPVAGGNKATQTKVSRVSGRLTAFQGKQVKLNALVGDQRIRAALKASGSAAKADSHDQGYVYFVFENLPAGAKVIVAEIDGVEVTLKFPKSASQADAMAAQIPETYSVDDALDLGELSLAAGGYLTAQHNPYVDFIDTDQDGSFDYYDTDIDGDGELNIDDDTCYGDEYLGWEWDEEYGDTWDDDGDGSPDWAEEDFTWTDEPAWELCDDLSPDCIPFCTDATPEDEMCLEECDPALDEDCYPIADECDPATEICDDECDPATEICDDECDPATEICDDECDPATEICDEDPCAAYASDPSAYYTCYCSYYPDDTECN